MMESAIYFGSLRHRRFRPAGHEFTYPIFMAFLDIDRIPELMKVSRLAGYNRWNWAGFCERDHFGDIRRTQRERVAADAAAHGLELPDGQIFLLTHLRYLGYNFNPVSFYYCYDRQENLKMVLAEVSNTFGETRNYWLSPENQVSASDRAGRWEFAKSFHVSPFIGMNARYAWTLTPPEKNLVIQTNVAEQGEPVFDGTLRMERRPWNARWLRHALVRFPWITARTIAAIHWQAIRLYFKKVPVVHHPGPGKFARANARHIGANWSIQ